MSNHTEGGHASHANSAEEALRRARAHLVQAALEGLEAMHLLLEAATSSSGLAGPSGNFWTDPLRDSLENLRKTLRENASFALPTAFSAPLAAALEAEIKRWEERSQTDPDARPVLRTFLGLRELLWELGMRREPPPESQASAARSESRSPARPKRDRIQRFDIED